MKISQLSLDKLLTDLVKTLPADNGSIWRAILKTHLKDVLLLTSPSYINDYDFSIPFEFYDTQLEKLFPERKNDSDRNDDILVKVKRQDPKRPEALLYIRVQSTFKEDFSELMFRYYGRLFYTYDLPVICLVILIDDDPEYYPDRFSYEAPAGVTSMYFQYPIYKVLTQDEKPLKNSENPFASIVSAVANLLKSI